MSLSETVANQGQPPDAAPSRISGRPVFRPWIRRLHMVVGLAAGTVVFLVSLTGCLYVFEEELFYLLHPRLTRVAPSEAPPQPASALFAAAQSVLDPGERATWLYWRDRSRAVPISTFKKDESAAGLFYWDELRHNTEVFVHPRTAGVQGVLDRRFEFFTVVLQLHQSLLLRYDIGHYIVGTSVLLFMGLLASGLILWWPRNRGALKQRFRIAWSAGKRRLRFDLHAVTGIYVWLPVLLIAATGLVWSFGWWEKGFYLLLTCKAESPWAGETAVESRLPDPVPAPAGVHPVDAGALDRAFYEVLRRVKPDGWISMTIPEDPKGVIWAAWEEERHSLWHSWSSAEFDQYTGAILKADPWTDKNAGKRWRNSNYNIHVGKIWGWPTQVLAFLASAFCATLPVTGFLMWRGRRSRGKAAMAEAPTAPSRSLTRGRS